jgi:hypothetical protein
MTILTTRVTTSGIGVTAKNSPLTNAEVDNNFISLNDNKLERNSSIAVTTISAAGAISSTSVYASGAITSLTTINAATTVSSGSLYVGGAATSLGILYAATTSLLAIGGGFVGIGTTSPSTKLQVAGAVSSTTLYAAAITSTGTIYASSSIINGISWLLVNNVVQSQYLEFGDTNKAYATIGGVYESANAGHLEFYTLTGGISTEKMRIDSAGNVGIGTSSASTLLQVAGAISSTTIYASGAVTSLTTINAATQVSSATLYVATNVTSLGTINAATQVSAATVYVATNVTSLGTINAATTVSSGTLYVGGAVSATGIVYTATTSLLAAASGFVGVGVFGSGTASPVQQLHVGNSTYPRIRVQRFGGFGYTDMIHQYGDSTYFGLSSATGDYSIFLGSGTAATALGTDRATSLIIGTNNLERMRIDSSGYVGIGTNIPTSTLDILGLAANTSNTNVGIPTGTLSLNTNAPSSGIAGEFGASLVFKQSWYSITPTSSIAVGQITGYKTGSNGNFGGGLTFWTAVAQQNYMAERIRIDDAGNVGIGTSSSANKLQVAGSFSSTSVYASGAITSLTTINAGTQVSAATVYVATNVTSLGTINAATQVSSATLYVATNVTSLGTINAATQVSSATLYVGGAITSLSTINAATTVSSATIYASGNITSGAVIYGNILAPTTITSNGVLYTSGEAKIHGITVGIGNNGVTTNTALGVDVLKVNQATGTNNTGLGWGVLISNSTGTLNTGVGYGAQTFNTTGIQNVAVGANSLYYNTSASNNVAIGVAALQSNTTGNNVAVGFNAGNANTTGQALTAIGYAALVANTTGNSNTALGYYAGSSITTGTNNILIGYMAGASDPAVNNEITLGNASIASLRIPGVKIYASTTSMSVGTSVTGAYTLQVAGSFAATTKSFVIPHPTKPNQQLRYGSLEGPENGVYVRGRLDGEHTINLPDYWTGLIDPDTITVNLTPFGRPQNLYVEDIHDNKVIIAGDVQPHCYYTVYAERKDVAKLVVEF